MERIPRHETPRHSHGRPPLEGREDRDRGRGSPGRGSPGRAGSGRRVGDALAPACGEEGTSGEVLASSSEAAEYDLAARPEGHDVTRIQHAVQAIRTAYFGTGGVYASRVSAVLGLKGGLEEIPQDSNVLLDLIVSAIGLASGGLSGFLMTRLLTAMGAVLDRGAHPHNAIGPAPPRPELASRIVTSLARLAVTKVEGKSKDAVMTKVRNELATTDKGPSVAAFINGQVDCLETDSNETVGGSVSFTLPSGLLGEPRLPPDHIVPSFFREHGRRYFGMGPNADPQLAASIAVHRDLLGASL